MINIAEPTELVIFHRIVKRIRIASGKIVSFISSMFFIRSLFFLFRKFVSLRKNICVTEKIINLFLENNKNLFNCKVWVYTKKTVFCSTFHYWRTLFRWRAIRIPSVDFLKLGFRSKTRKTEFTLQIV